MQYKFTVILVFIGILFFLFSKVSYSQTENNYQIKFLNLLVNNEAHNPQKHSHSGLIGLYKTYISSQDVGNCPYSPSCSIYTHHAIKEYGVLFGLIKGFDRLSRCNRHQSDHYKHDIQHKLIDQP